MKIFFALVTAAAALTMSGCTSDPPVIGGADSMIGANDAENLSKLGVDVSDIRKAEYVHCGPIEELELSDAEKAALSEWLGGLKLEHRTYPDGEAPGDSDGGEAYLFTFSDGELSYVNNGMEDRFILFEGEWYALIKPEKFPIEL
ncbi:MAG: hypothetical protein K2N38_11465 [Oscillospiraceae bacterium]|nr:hypothetical protein [Oscillospiraceae bacterium]